jgi:hypothetical protein
VAKAPAFPALDDRWFVSVSAQEDVMAECSQGLNFPEQLVSLLIILYRKHD